MSEPRKLDTCKQVATSTTATDVTIGSKMVILKNIDSTNAIYFKEKNGVACTTSNGYKLAAGEESERFYANVLSVVAGADTPTLCMMTLID